MNLDAKTVLWWAAFLSVLVFAVNHTAEAIRQVLL
jgi:hypothetical protein